MYGFPKQSDRVRVSLGGLKVSLNMECNMSRFPTQNYRVRVSLNAKVDGESQKKTLEVGLSMGSKTYGFPE